MNRSFAAFIMTYERPAILEETISKVFAQSFPPQKILVVDNSQSNETEIMIKGLGNPAIEYYRVGYNSGPAGAAKIGLQKLTDAGYDWIYWGDDDNPPDFNDAFEILFHIVSENPSSIGVVAAVGQRFNKLSGNIIRVSNAVIQRMEKVEVDSIAGGMSMIINGEVVRKDALPDARLFFGFEELDFCLKVKKMGYQLYASSDLFIKSRQKFNRLDYARPMYTKRNKNSLSRQYYSTRNLFVVLKRNRLYSAVIYQLLKSILKSIYGFRYGFVYGTENFTYISKGLYHGIFGYSTPMLK